VDSILDKVSFEKYVFKKERLKILSIKNRFHCLSANCVGYFVKTETNKTQDPFMKCTVCQEINCLNCQVIVKKSEINKHECIQTNERQITDPLKVLIVFQRLKYFAYKYIIKFELGFNR